MDKKKPLVLKYEEIQNYSQVLETHKFLQDLGNVIIDNTINSAKNVSVAADNLSRTQIPLLVLQLILKRYGSEKEQRVNLEFSKEELEAFLKKLNKLKNDIFNLDIQQ
ncbi:hypothetical protein ABPG74_015122 [Tetrahymena malaccensis]